MVFRMLILQTGAKRVPLIKFRKGGYGTNALPGSTGSNQNSTTIEDWELPPRFARKPISQEEMEYINTGGPA